MLVTLAAMMCLAGSCQEIAVSNSDQMPGLTAASCPITAQWLLASWKGQHPIYSKEPWELRGWKCYLGTFTPKRDA
jgi:hypothetical protein